MNLHTLRRGKRALATALCAAACSQLGLAQVAAPSILQIDIADHVLYFEDAADPAKFATDPNVPTRVPTLNFARSGSIADIVAVNGQRVMGNFATSYTAMFFRLAPTPGLAIGDTTRNAIGVATFEILKSDGTQIGTIVASGHAGGTAPPGSPLTVTGGNNFVITGGTGAFLGARGQIGVAAAQPGVAVQRTASMTEDPANRRRNGGGSQRWIAHVIPMARPEVTMLPAGPAIAHSSDFSLVTTSKPAAQGEILSLFARGLGPVIPGVDPGKPFPSGPLAVVNSPVEVIVNGKAAEVLGAVGYPGAVDAYQVNFRVPADTAKGAASIHVTAAWISGAPVSIPVQ
jgi:uncharacterized protein (TIGR03437 family)